MAGRQQRVLAALRAGGGAQSSQVVVTVEAATVLAFLLRSHHFLNTEVKVRNECGWVAENDDRAGEQGDQHGAPRRSDG